jgi:hypothetical protein
MLSAGKEQVSATVTSLRTTPEIVTFYPSRSLVGQLKAWRHRRGGNPMRISFERKLAGIRRQIRRADFAVIDATEDPAQAADAFFQVYNALGADALAVYTEIVHDSLEFLVRRVGVPLLLGPMSVPEWDDYFVRKFPRILPLSATAGALSPVPSSAREESEAEPVILPYPYRSIAG